MIAGITQGSRLVKASSLSSAKNLTRGSDVASINNLTLWLETTGALTEQAIFNGTNFDLEDGDNVTSWVDVNPQKTQKIAFDGTLFPAIYRRNGINGLPSLSFTENISVKTSFIGPAPIAAGDDTFTFFAVIQSSSAINTSINKTFLFQGVNANGPASRSFYFTQYNNSNWIVSLFGPEADSGVSNVSGRPTILAARMRNQTQNLSFAVNSKNYTNHTISDPVTFNIGNGLFYIGSPRTMPSVYFEGFISEIIIYDNSLSVNVQSPRVMDWILIKNRTIISKLIY